MDPAVIDRIVASVLEQLHTPVVAASTAPKTAILAPPSVEPLAVPAVVSRPKTVAAIGLTTPVVTAAVLEKVTLPVGGQLLVGPKTVLTPSAHDWLKQHKITWKRSHNGETASAKTDVASRWQFLVSTVTPTVRSLLDQVLRSHPDWKRQLLGGVEELVEVGIRLLATAEAQRVFVISGSAEVVACRTNRNDKVRAAVIASADQLRVIEAELAPNLIVVNPAAKSLMELRHLVRACSLLPAPKPPEWAQGK